MNILHNAKIIMLTVIFCSTVELSSAKTDDSIRKNAATQLDRLTLFRKTVALDKSNEDLKHEQKVETNHLDDLKNSTNDFTIPIELLQYLRKHFTSETLANSQSKKRIDEILADPNYNAIMVERIKRGGTSGSFLSGIASKLVGGIASASSSSSGSSSNNQYGNSHTAQTFDIWDFKKAVLNTLLQAVKAISGSVLALKGQIVKGGGFLISTKGKIISSAGEAITSLGRNIASSAVIVAPKPQQQQPYPYQPDHYNNPYNNPPHSDEFSSDLSAPPTSFGNHNNADDSSEENDGVKTTGTDIKEFNSHSTNLAALEDSFGGPQKGISLASLLSSSIEPPRQENLHNHGLDNFPVPNNGKPAEYHTQLTYSKEPYNYDTTFSTLSPLRDPATNLVNHILQETNLNYQNLNNLKYHPNADYLQGAPTYNNYGKIPPNYPANYPPTKTHHSESNIQPPQLPLLPHLNPEDLMKIQYEKSKGYSSSGYPASQEPLKIPLYQLDQPPHNSWPASQSQYPFRDHRPNILQHSSPAFDIQASVDITPGEYRDGKFHRI